MKKIFFFILTIISLTAFSQSRIPIRGDSIVIEKLGGNAELILLNGSRNLQYGYLQNIGNGRTKFHYALDSVWIEGDSLVFRYGPGTLKVIHGGGGGGTTYAAGYGLNLSSTTFKVDTANISTKLWRQKGIDSILGLLSSNYYTQTQINSFFGGTTPIGGYNKTNWDLAFSWGNHAGLYPTISRFMDSVAALRADIGGGSGIGDMTKAVYDTDNDGYIDNAVQKKDSAGIGYATFKRLYKVRDSLVNAYTVAIAAMGLEQVTDVNATTNNEIHSYGGFSVVDANGSLETAFLTTESYLGNYGGALTLRSPNGNSNTLLAAITLGANRANRLPNVTGTLANSVTANGTNYPSDANGVIDIGTISGGGGTPGGSTTQVQVNIGGAFAGNNKWTRDTTNNSWAMNGSTANPYPYTVYKNVTTGDTMALHTVGVDNGTHYFDYNPSGAFTIRSRTGGGTATPQFTVSGSSGAVSARGAISWQYNSGFGGSILGQLGATSVSTDSYGTIQFGSSANAYLGNIYTDVLTANRIYKTPNRSGTIALREDITDSLNTYRASDSLYFDSTYFEGSGTLASPVTLKAGAGGSGYALTGNTLGAEGKFGSLDAEGVSFVTNNVERMGIGVNTGNGGLRTISFGNNARSDPNPNNSTMYMNDTVTYDASMLNQDLVAFGAYQGLTKTVDGTGSIFGITPEIRWSASTTHGVGGYYGVQVIRASMYAAPGSTGSINKAFPIIATSHLEGMTVDSLAKVYIEDSYRPGGGTVANNIGLFIQAQRGASTANFNIYSQGSSTTGGNFFGGPVVANTYMRLDFLAGGGSRGIGVDNDGKVIAVSGGGGGDVFTKTLASDGSDNNVQINSTSSGSTAAIYQVGMLNQLLPGYTGSGGSITAQFNNTTAGTGTDPFVNDYANFALYGISASTTTGTNVGARFSAQGGALNIGGMFMARVNKNSGTNVGVMGLGINGGTSPEMVGGYFGLLTSAPALASAALYADNGATTHPIFAALDNSSTVFRILDGGIVQIYNSAIGTPASTPSGSGYLFVEGGALKYKGSSGTVTTIANP